MCLTDQPQPGKRSLCLPHDRLEPTWVIRVFIEGGIAFDPDGFGITVQQHQIFRRRRIIEQHQRRLPCQLAARGIVAEQGIAHLLFRTQQGIDEFRHHIGIGTEEISADKILIGNDPVGRAG